MVQSTASSSGLMVPCRAASPGGCLASLGGGTERRRPFELRPVGFVESDMVESLLKDVRYALRWMRRSPGFSAVAILSLGLGVGVNTAMFSLVDSLLFRPLPVESPSTLVDVFTSGGDLDEYATSSYADFLDLKAKNTVFTDVTGYSPM